MHNFEKALTYFLATCIVLLGVSQTTWFSRLTQADWFVNMATAFSLTGVGLKDVIIALFVLITLLRQLVTRKLPYPVLYLRADYRCRYDHLLPLSLARRDHFFISWYLYAVEKGLQAIVPVEMDVFLLTSPLSNKDSPKVDLKTVRGIFFSPTYLLRFVKNKRTRKKVQVQLKLTLSLYFTQVIPIEDVFLATSAVISGLGVRHNHSTLRRLWHYLIIAHTSLSINENTLLPIYSLEKKIVIEDYEYSKVIVAFQGYLNTEQTMQLGVILENIDNTLNNAHKLQVIELKFIKKGGIQNA